MHDAHVHLDFMTNGEQVAARAEEAGVALFANTVTPDGYAAAQARFSKAGNVRVGWGMHPWWVDLVTSPERRCAIPDGERFIGEVGLDFGRRHEGSRDIQLETFTAIAQTCARQGGKILSIHSVHAARETLDVLESTQALDSCTCVFHWFTGPSDQLKRAIDAGCYFSAGPRMLATGKGREYVKAIPASKLLLETDAPPQQNCEYSFDEMYNQLVELARSIEAIKGEGAVETADDTFQSLFGPVA